MVTPIQVTNQHLSQGVASSAQYNANLLSIARSLRGLVVPGLAAGAALSLLNGEFAGGAGVAGGGGVGAVTAAQQALDEQLFRIARARRDVQVQTTGLAADVAELAADTVERIQQDSRRRTGGAADFFSISRSADPLGSLAVVIAEQLVRRILEENPPATQAQRDARIAQPGGRFPVPRPSPVLPPTTRSPQGGGAVIYLTVYTLDDPLRIANAVNDAIRQGLIELPPA